jgi:hypothetical protein
MLTPLIIERNNHRMPQPGSKDVPMPVQRFFLEVQIQVPAIYREEFATQGKELLETFASVGLTPATSAWRTDRDPIIVVNYWDLGQDANALFYAELALPDIPGFNRFNALVGKETKNIVIPICGDSSVSIPDKYLDPHKKLPSEGFRYLRVVSQVSSLQLHEFIARLDGYLELFTRKAEWFHGDTYLGITGDEGTVVQMWLIPENKAAAVPKTLAKAPWLDNSLVQQSTFEILRATDSDPYLEASDDFGSHK